jgi:peptidoglycan/LPS O-acetylase OafA/YrhL
MQALSSTETRAAVAPNPSRRLDIQGLRGIAVLVVVLYHAGLGVPGGFLGVDMFLVISGHVITLGLVRELERTDRVDLLAFVRRRIRRLLPALAVMLVVVVIIQSMIGALGTQGVTMRTAVAAALFSANMSLLRETHGYFDVAAELNPLLHTWSLSLEEQFYFLFPALLVAGWYVARVRRRHRHLGLRWAVLAMSATSLAIMLASSGSEFAFFALPARAWEFGIGALTALVPRIAVLRVARIATAATVVSALALVFCLLSYSEHTAFPGVASIPPVIATAMIIWCGPHGVFARGVGARPLVRVGDISYSWYLWHWPLIVFAATLVPDNGLAVPLAAAVSLLPAIGSYRFIEQRWRHNDAAHGSITRLAVTSIGAPLAAVALVTVATAPFGAAEARFDSAETASLDQRLDCAGPVALGARADACTIDRDDTDRDIVVVGDSTAGMFTDALELATSGVEGPISDLTFATYYGCPFADVLMRREGVENRACTSYVDQTVDDLIERRPDLVVVALATDVYPRRDSIELAAPSTEPSWLSGSEDKAAVLAAGLGRTLEALERHGVEVLLVGTIPKFEPWDLTACSAAAIRFGPERCAPRERREVLDEERGATVDSERDAASRAGADFVDVTNALCEETCATFRDGEWWWKDGGHLSVFGASKTVGVLADRLNET